MIGSIWDFLSTEGFQPHGMCLLWRPDVFWMHIASDLVIALSYFSIPAALWYLASRRPDLMYRKVIYLFGAFIVACGITHLAGIWTMWVPDYSIEALFKVATALISVAAATALWPVMPKLLALPSHAQLEHKNQALSGEIADRKFAEARLQELNEELESRVAERTASISKMNAELESERARAEQANTTKSQFLATMSHEIRTPMNGVLGATDVLERSNMTEEQRKFVYIIGESGRSLMNLLNDILDLSKIEAGHVELALTDCSIDELLRSTNTLWSHTARNRGLSFSINNTLTDCDRIKGDRHRLRQVLNNLVSNAIKFTEKGVIVVEAGEVSRRDGKVLLRFAVTDTGIGISEEQQERLFQPFTQADGSTTRKYGGTGLGLSICKNLVTLMGGEIGVESAPNRGSTFWFTVSVDAAATGHPPPAEPEVSSDIPALAQSSRRVRILLAEDNSINRLLVSCMLENLNCDMDTVENGLEAVAAVKKTDYDLILMDIQMPEMDGVAATKEIRTRTADGGRIPIIALTANAMAGDRERYLQAGLTDYVSKPVNRKDLLSVIARHVNISSSAVNDRASDRHEEKAAPQTDHCGEETARELNDLTRDLDDIRHS